jgi:hypothetical protein
MNGFVLVYPTAGPSPLDDKKANCVSKIFSTLGLINLGLRVGPVLVKELNAHNGTGTRRGKTH